MSYPPLGYSTYTTPTPANLTASQLLLSQATPPTLSPSIPTPTNSPSCNIETRPTTLTSADPVTSPTAQNVYTSGLLNYPSARMPGLTETMSTLYNTAYATQGYVPFGTDPSAFYSPLAGNNTDAWRNLQGGAWPYDPTMAAYPYSTGYGGLDVRRKNATREATSTLKAWLYEHIKNPYPTKGEKIMLAIITKMTLTQVSTWFANARRRLKKENKMQWSPRNRSGEDEDEDDKDSDTEQSDNRHENGGKTGGRADDKDVEDDEDDEDIIVDGCTTNDSFKLLSPGDKSDDSSLLDLRDTSSCLDMSAIGQQQGNVPHASFSASTSPVDSSHITNSYLSPSSNLSDPKDSLQHYATSNTQHHQQQQHPPNHQQHPHHHHHVHHPLPKDSTTAQNSSSQGNNKPRIWSMADMAIPSQPQLDIRRSPTAIAQSLISKSGYTAFTSPTSQPHPALNGSYHGLASANAAASTGLSPYRLANYMAAPGGGSCGGTGVHVPCSSVAPGILPNFHRPTSISVLASAAAGPGSCSQRITQGVLGSPLDGSRLGGSLATNPLSNTATAFKPVPRRQNLASYTQDYWQFMS